MMNLQKLGKAWHKHSQFPAEKSKLGKLFLYFIIDIIEICLVCWKFTDNFLSVENLEGGIGNSPIPHAMAKTLWRIYGSLVMKSFHNNPIAYLPITKILFFSLSTD